MEKEQLDLYKKIQRYDYVSFDLFDTLIFRTVEDYTDIFSCVEVKYNTISKKKINNYKIERMWAEEQARYKAKGREICIDDIRNELPYELDIADKLISLEEELEVENCVPNQMMIDVVKLCEENKKIIAITTDMYLSRQCIKKILKKIGVNYTYLLISGDNGVTKMNGGLYEILLEKICVTPSNLIHIGDNYHSDKVMAERYGISSEIRILGKKKKIYTLERQEHKIGINHLIALINTYFINKKEIHSYERIGYGVIGPVLLEFCRWVHQKKKDCKIEELWFIAREGYLIKKVYELMYPDECGDLKYICLNKNLLRLPMLYLNNSVENFLRLLPDFSLCSWKNLFEMIGIDESEELVKILRGMNCGFNIEDLVSKKDLLEHRYDVELQVIIQNVADISKMQYTYLIRYLNNEGIYGKRIGLVNNSYNGIAQRQLVDLVSNAELNVNWIGIQFIASHKTKEYLGEDVIEWLEKKVVPEHIRMDFYRDCIIFEHLLFENIGTALFFREDTVGKVQIVKNKLRKESNNKKYVEKVQREALKFVKDYCTHVDIKIGTDVIKLYNKFNKYPMKEDCEAFEGLYDCDFQGEKRIIDYDKKFHYKFLLGGKKIPISVIWVGGFFKTRNIGKLKFQIYNFINILRDSNSDINEWRLLINDKYIIKNRGKIKIILYMRRLSRKIKER